MAALVAQQHIVSRETSIFGASYAIIYTSTSPISHNNNPIKNSSVIYYKHKNAINAPNTI